MISIDFTARNEDVEACVNRPEPAKNFMPEWYKNMPATNPHDHARTAKACMPFMDSFTSGYIQPLWCDVEIKGNKISFHSDFRPISTTEGIKWHDNLFPKYEGYKKIETHWLTQWEPITTQGYSTLYSHPFNRYDLPFITLTGIMETDEFNTPGTLPFIIKEDFNGVIKKGTPIYQMFPFLRGNFKINSFSFDKYSRNIQVNNIKKHPNSGYKKEYWKRKKYL
jgi:hypothetical protein